MEAWANIPSVILLEIMEYLSRNDRFSCGVVCKNWYMTMVNPLLWKSMQISLDADLSDPLTEVTVKRYAPHITSLDLSWSAPYLPQRWIKNKLSIVAHDTCRFLMMLNKCEINLQSFRLTDWNFTWKFKKVIYHLTIFLKQQYNIKYLNLSNAYLNKVEMMRILFACKNSASSVIYLDLLGSFHEWHNVYMNTHFVAALRQFENLQVLKVDYSSVSEISLSAFVDNGCTSLKFIEIHIKDIDSRSHVMEAEIWYQLKERCKDLKVGLNLHNICHYEDMYYILINTIPLANFSLICGHFWDQSRTRNYCGTLHLLLSHYENTLTHVSLQLRNNREIVDYYIYDLIRKCKQLQFLEFDGVLKSINLVGEICMMQVEENVQGFKYFHVRPRTSYIYSNLILSDIWRTYIKQMEQNGFNFEIETFNVSAVRIFC